MKSRILLPTLTVLLTALSVLSPPANAEGPSGGSFAFTGHGFGHGRGLSQYGAQGAALRGLNATQILDFYYPGTQTGSASGPIRIQLTADQDGDTVIGNAVGLVVRDVTTGQETALQGANLWRLRAAGGQSFVEYGNGGGWMPYLTVNGVAEFRAPTALSLRTAAGDRPYRGSLRQVGGGTVNVLDLEDYLKGVVPREMPASWHPVALQAQTVAARSYAVRLRDANAARNYDLCDTTACQVYGGAKDEVAATNNAIAATAGQIRTYQGAAAFTEFSSSSGGFTAAGNVPYLLAQPDPYDDFSGNPMHTWTRAVPASSVQQAFPSVGDVTDITVTARDGRGDWGGRVTQVRISGNRGSTVVTGAVLRSRLGLRSDWFALSGPATASQGEAAITAHYNRVRGKRTLGKARGPVRFVAGGAFRVYRKGRIYWSPSTGAVVLKGRTLRVYLRHGGPWGALGFPTRPTHRAGKRTRATDFVNGVITLKRGRAQVSVR